MNNFHVHELTGLKSDALATYLAALGVLRLLAEQRDLTARGFWRDEHFAIVTELDWESIERFFLEPDGYAPTPILAPWNMESGFFSLKPTEGNAQAFDEALGDGSEAADGVPVEDDDQAEEESDETDQAVGDPLLDRFANTAAKRFGSFRRGIEIAQTAISGELRKAEENARRVHGEIAASSTEDRGKHEDALKKVADTDSLVASLRAEVDAKKAAVKGAAKGAPEREELKRAQERLKAAQDDRKALKKQATELEKQLKAAEKRAKGDKDLKKRIAEAKVSFKEIQGATKDRLIADLRARWGAEDQQWVDAAIALNENGEAGFTSLFGSGGNDGRMEFTRNLRYHLDVLFDVGTGEARDGTAARLKAAIFGTPTNLLIRKAVGQFFPGRAGGPNMGAGFFGSAGVNPWEFVLMLEGAVALVAGMSRRGDVEKARVSSPFWVEGASAGFGSASEREGNPRGEQWLPLWSQPLCHDELVELIREGRAQVGRGQTTRAASLVRATARLGLARGIDSLQRFAYLQRNGQSNLAVSTGRFRAQLVSEAALPEGMLVATQRQAADDEPVQLLAPVASVQYQSWRQQMSSAPADLLAALHIDTRTLQENGWSAPPGSRELVYWRPADAFSSRPTHGAPMAHGAAVADAALFALATDRKRDVLPLMERALPTMELLRRALLSKVGDEQQLGRCPELTGKDEQGQRLQHEHRHAHFLPLSLDARNRGRIDHVFVYAPMGFGALARRALRRLRKTWAKGTDDIAVTLLGLGSRESFREVGGTAIPELASSATWASQTPFIPPRFLKPSGKDSLEGQVRAELQRRGLPGLVAPPTVAVPTDENDAARQARWYRHFARSGGKASPPPGLFHLTLTLESPIEGPLCLGWGCHFGFGLFVPPGG